MNDGRGRKHDLAILLYIVKLLLNKTRTVIKQVLYNGKISFPFYFRPLIGGQRIM